MKTTIELNGYTIVIEDTEGSITVSAIKDEETVEEFTLEVGGEESTESGIKSFGEEEDDFSEAEEDLEDAEDDLEDAEEDFEDGDVEDAEEEVANAEDEEEEFMDDAPKLESFSSFIKKRK